MKARKLITYFTGVLLCLSTLDIAAADPVVYSADYCMHAATAGGSTYTGTPGYQQGTITNGHLTADMALVCPIVGLGENEEISSVQVRVWDANTNANEAVQCTLGCHDAESSEGYTSDPDSSTTQDDTLLFSIGSSENDYTDGGCSIYCTLPNKGTWYSFILEYKVTLE
jgi:hypothetical protein